MKSPMRVSQPVHQRSKLLLQQRGVYALEWAFVFPVFFLLLYAVITYGLTFLVRESMQYAVEDGIRAALRYPVGVQQPNWNHRRLAAMAVVTDRLSWLPAPLRPASNEIIFTVCPLSQAACDAQTALNPVQTCDVEHPCLVLMRYTVENYPHKSITPPIWAVLLPARLNASASILVDRRLV